MKESIFHKGRILSVDKHLITVDIEADEHECRSCSIAHLCRTKSGTRLTLPYINAESPLSPGQSVKLRASGQSRLSAIGLLLIIPTFLVLATAACVAAMTKSEEATAVASLLTVAIYFIGLYFARRHTASVVKWEIEPLEK